MERKAEAISDARKAKKGTSFNKCVSGRATPSEEGNGISTAFAVEIFFRRSQGNFQQRSLVNIAKIRGD